MFAIVAGGSFTTSTGAGVGSTLITSLCTISVLMNGVGWTSTGVMGVVFVAVVVVVAGGTVVAAAGFSTMLGAGVAGCVYTVLDVRPAA